MKFKLLLISILFVSEIFSCDCPPISKIDLERIKSYDVIFVGKVDSVVNSEKEGMGKAYFLIDTLFKGTTAKTIVINFDCVSSCMMSFEKGEKWLIYAKYEKFDYAVAHFCEHSRKSFLKNEDDTYYALIAGQSFKEEIAFLLKQLGVKEFVKNNELNEMQTLYKPHNDQPSGINKIILLILSFLSVIVIYYFGRKKKNNGK